jgi:excisionase family DNA binding protein
METPLYTLTTEAFKTLIKESVRDVLTEYSIKTRNEETLLNVQEAAALLNLAVATLYEKTSDKVVPHYKHGKKLLFKKSELLAWVESTRIKTLKQIREESTRFVNRKRI